MIKGIDYIGVNVAFYCHDGEGNYVLHKRGAKCRDENGNWDFGGGSVECGEKIEEALVREIFEEYGTKPISYEFMGFDEVFREHQGSKTHWLAFRYKVQLDHAEVINGEPESHDEIGWFSIDTLPSPMHSQTEKVFIKYKEYFNF